MLEALLYIAAGALIGAGVAYLWHMEEAAETWGRHMELLARLEDGEHVELDEVRIVYRGVPTEDGGGDLL